MTPEGTRPRIVARHVGLVGRTFFVSALTLVSRILGFVREVVMASVFGDSSAVSDAFFTAWRVPNLFRRLLGEGALSTSLQSAVTEADGRGGDEAGRRLFLRTIGLAAVILSVVWAAVTLGVMAMPDRMPVTEWAWLGSDPGPVRDLAVRVLPYVVLVCLAALASGALQVRGHYAVPNLAPVLMNVIWIAALVGIGVSYGWGASAEGTREEVLLRQWSMARLLAWGVLVGGVLQLFLHVPPLQRFGLLGRRTEEPPSPSLDNEGHGAWYVLKTSLPLAVGAAVYQVNVMIDGLMAESMLRDGGPTALYYANRIQQFPLALVATAALSSVFPALQAHGHLRQLPELRRLHDRAQLGILFLVMPAAVGTVVLAQPISSVLFEHGNYGAEGVERIAAALRMVGLALVPAGALGLLSRAYIALDDRRTPVRVSIWMVLLNITLNVAFVAGLDMDVAGLALATAVTSWGNLVWLTVGLGRRLGLPAGEPGLPRRLFVQLLAALTAGGLAQVAWLGTGALASGVPDGVRLALAIGTGMLAFAAAAQVLGMPEWIELRERLARRAGR